MKKKILYILLLFPILASAQVNMWTYDTGNGGNNNGVIELSEAQKCIDENNDIIVSPSTTMTFSSTLFVDQNRTQNIDFGGSTITRTGPVEYLLRIDKRNLSGTSTTISNLDVDGNSVRGSLVYVASEINMTNVDIHDARDDSNSREPRGIWMHVTDGDGVGNQWVFDDVNISWIWNSTSPGVNQTDSKAQGFYLYWPEKKTGGLQIVYKNSSIHDIYGDEGDGIIINTPNNDISFTDNSFWAENLLIYNCQRRAVKGYAGNTTWINSDFYTADYDNPYINTNWISAGLFALGAGSSNPGSENHLVCGCNFYGGWTEPLDGWDERVILGGVYGDTGVEFRHTTFNGDNPRNTAINPGDQVYAGLKIGHDTGAIKICDCDFTLASTSARGNKIVQGFPGALNGGKYQIDSNNTYAIGQSAALAGLSTSKYDVVDLSSDCAVCPTIGGITGDITAIRFVQSQTDTVNINEGILNPKWQLEPVTTETGESYTYAIETGADGALFSIVNTDELQYNGTFDFELPVDTNTNNVYGVNIEVTSTSGNTHVENVGIYVQDVVEGGETYVTSIAFDNNYQTIRRGQQADLSHTFNGGATTPDNTGVWYATENSSIVLPDGTAKDSGTITFKVTADDTTNGTIEGTMTINVNNGVHSVQIGSGSGQTYIRGN